MLLATKYWSFLPGKKVDPNTGELISSNEEVTIIDWYNTIFDVFLQIKNEYGELTSISLYPDSFIAIMLEVLQPYLVKETTINFPDDLFIGSIVIDKTVIPIFKLEEAKTSDLFVTVEKTKHVKIHILDSIQ